MQIGKTDTSLHDVPVNNALAQRTDYIWENMEMSMEMPEFCLC
jgi:hypothetical protein